ncbi:MAG: Gfo/Idh/MocA family oxidoreductase [Planctomycetes bacterium]|nr:Gfo/Idh/MocA family oxidoreductase [Planctomycetota bacterium]
MKTTIHRRQFLARSSSAVASGALGTALAVTAPRSARAVSANDRIVLAVIGIRGRGNKLACDFAARDDCEVAYLCDVDSRLFESRSKAVAERQDGRTPKCVQDFRRALEDKSVDAVVIATPDHWHALATVWSCQAGKDVYVEKPASHTPWEGRKMVEAARKYKRVVQLGTQTRSAPYFMAARKYIENGGLGKLYLCRVFNQVPHTDPKMAEDSDPPKGLDWDMWNGPAPETRYNYTYWEHWNWFWRYSGGDIINNGVHQIDMARHLCGVTYPKSVYSTGGRFHATGCADAPNTQIATFDFDNLVMTFELTWNTPYMLKVDPGVRNGDLFPYWLQCSTRVEIYGDEAVMFIGRVGGDWQVFVRTKNRKPVVKDQMYGRFPDDVHQENFIQCVRSRERPHADILEGHLSTLLCQYANISYRLGGEKLIVDPKTETFTNSPNGNQLLRREYRKPWVLEEQV